MSLASQGCTHLGNKPLLHKPSPKYPSWDDVCLRCTSGQSDCYPGSARPRVVSVYRLNKWNENESPGSLHNVCVLERKNTLVALQTSRAWCHKSGPITGSRRWMSAANSWKESKRKYTVNLATTRLNYKRWLLASSRLLPANNCFPRKEP